MASFSALDDFRSTARRGPKISIQVYFTNFVIGTSPASAASPHSRPPSLPLGEQGLGRLSLTPVLAWAAIAVIGVPDKRRVGAG